MHDTGAHRDLVRHEPRHHAGHHGRAPPLWARVAERYGRKLMVARALLELRARDAARLAIVTRPWQVLALRAMLGLFAGYGPIAMTMAAESVAARVDGGRDRLGADRAATGTGARARDWAEPSPRPSDCAMRSSSRGSSARSCWWSSATARQVCARPPRPVPPPVRRRGRPSMRCRTSCSFSASSSACIAASAQCCRSTWARSDAAGLHRASVSGSLFTITAGAAALGHHLESR